MANTKMQISAELLSVWTDAALASRDATDILLLKALELTWNNSEMDEEDVAALQTLLRAARYAGISNSVFASLMETEVRIALKVGETQ